MSYLVLARKYRPQTFEQVIGQSHVTRTLTNAMKANRLTHAALFSGPRGTGKTTVARILAKAVNCTKGPTPQPCGQCRSCLEITAGSASDVFEIDGASNNGVDHIRELRENTRYIPVHSPRKIYIIDEVHMLSTPAFNALLKTLEEPPEHVMFIFATTEAHKIPITILSRCQQHDFKRLSMEAISNYMQTLCQQEKIEIDTSSLDMIARTSGGSMRDGLSLLDQVMGCSQGTITYELMLEILGIIDRKCIFDLGEAVFKDDISTILGIIDQVYNKGHQIKEFYNQLLNHFRNMLIIKLAVKPLPGSSHPVDLPENEIKLLQEQVQNIPLPRLNQILNLFKNEEAAIRFSKQAKLTLEMIFFRIFETRPALPVETLIAKLDRLLKNPEPIQTEAVKETPQKTVPVAVALITPQDPASWEKLLVGITKQRPALGTYLKKCSFNKLNHNIIELNLKNNESIQYINSKKNLFKKICNELCGQEYDLKLNYPEVSDEKVADDPKGNAMKQSIVSAALEIFEGSRIEHVNLL